MIITVDTESGAVSVDGKACAEERSYEQRLRKRIVDLIISSWGDSPYMLNRAENIVQYIMHGLTR